jgi:carboxylesterase type B
MPPITPSAWKNIRLVDNYPPVCPQSIPHLDAGMDALFKMPRYRFTQLRNIKSSLSNYSEDCLYLNMFVPKKGKCQSTTIVQYIYQQQSNVYRL